jgi:hypothetical protein
MSQPGPADHHRVEFSNFAVNAALADSSAVVEKSRRGRQSGSATVWKNSSTPALSGPKWLAYKGCQFVAAVQPAQRTVDDKTEGIVVAAQRQRTMSRRNSRSNTTTSDLPAFAGSEQH